MKLKKALSQRIKSLREASGLSQQDVATRGDLSLSLVAKLEQGKKADPRASTILSLAAALGVKPGQLLDDLFPPPGEAVTRGVAAPRAHGHAAEAKKDRKKKKEVKKKKPE
jgi:transcriptional regulator with XRE-family HTH domain